MLRTPMQTSLISNFDSIYLTPKVFVASESAERSSPLPSPSQEQPPA